MADSKSVFSNQMLTNLSNFNPFTLLVGLDVFAYARPRAMDSASVFLLGTNGLRREGRELGRDTETDGRSSDGNAVDNEEAMATRLVGTTTGSDTAGTVTVGSATEGTAKETGRPGTTRELTSGTKAQTDAKVECIIVWSGQMPENVH